MQELCSAPDRNQHLFDTYIDRRLKRGAASDYPKHQVLRWLSWLASQMVQEKQTVFLIEKMQPTWLKNRSEERAYRIVNFMIFGPINVLSGGAIGGVVGIIFGQVLKFAELPGVLWLGMPGMLWLGITTGMAAGIITGLVQSYSRNILLVEAWSWSWQKPSRSFVFEQLLPFRQLLLHVVKFEPIVNQTLDPSLWIYNFGGLGGALFGLSFGFLLGFLFPEFGIDVPNGRLIFGLIFGLSCGLGIAEVEHRSVPNQGIWASAKNCMIFAVPIGLIVGGVVGLIVRPMVGGVVGLSLLLSSGLGYGGLACIQHFTLRQILHRKGRIPWNYARFLDFAADRLLMKKVGGGYIFFHRMLLEHFAQMNPN